MLNDVRDRVGLPAAGDAEQHLVLVTVANPPDQRLDGGRLVARRGELAVQRELSLCHGGEAATRARRAQRPHRIASVRQHVARVSEHQGRHEHQRVDAVDEATMPRHDPAAVFRARAALDQDSARSRKSSGPPSAPTRGRRRAAGWEEPHVGEATAAAATAEPNALQVLFREMLEELARPNPCRRGSAPRSTRRSANHASNREQTQAPPCSASAETPASQSPADVHRPPADRP